MESDDTQKTGIHPEEVLSTSEPVNDANIDVGSLGEDSSEEWCFETDHVALKNNKDYTNLLKTTIILEAQRIQAVQNLEKLWEIKEAALRDPLEFVRKMKNGESLGIPPPIVVAKIPEIDWSQYKTGRPHMSRPIVKSPSKSTVEQLEEEERRRTRVRGREYDDSKPETFNQLWTTEEQQRLEELLGEFPPEDVEMRRWAKIADALGNRTAKQVCSRVQKYFLKLHKAGLPVPGRIPKKADNMKRLHLHQRNNHLLFRPTTFFPSKPFMMDDLRDEDYEIEEEAASSDEDEDEEEEEDEEDTMDISGKREEADRQLMIDLLTRVMEEKDVSDTSGAKHFGFKCDYCQEDPIVGSRWHCTDCADVDFCTDCVVTQLDSAERHPLQHRLQAVQRCSGSTRYDHDYKQTGRNYLDPNFRPNTDDK